VVDTSDTWAVRRSSEVIVGGVLVGVNTATVAAQLGSLWNVSCDSLDSTPIAACHDGISLECIAERSENLRMRKVIFLGRDIGFYMFVAEVHK
jgi:hypothetical protein